MLCYVIIIVLYCIYLASACLLNEYIRINSLVHLFTAFIADYISRDARLKLVFSVSRIVGVTYSGTFKTDSLSTNLLWHIQNRQPAHQRVFRRRLYDLLLAPILGYQRSVS